MISYLNKSGLKLKERLYSEITDSSNIFEISYDSVNSGVNFEAFENDIFKKIALPSALNQCDKVDFDSLQEFLEYKTRKIYLLKQIVDEEFVFYNEYLAGEKVKLEGALKEVKAKISFLGGFEGSVINTLVENFNNLLQLDSRSENTLKIDTDAEVCTLPVSRETKLDIKDIKILSSSNGIAGTIIEEENSYLSNAFNSNQNLYFEYYKRGRETLRLNIEITLNAESFVNYLEVSIKNKYLESNFQIEEVLYISSTGRTKSIFSCIGKEEQKLELASYNRDRKLCIAHLPVQANRVKIFLTCNEHSMINDAPYNVIALKEVALYRKAYDQNGVLTFKESLLESSGAAVLSAKVTSFPTSISEGIFKTKAVFEEEREEEIGAEFLILDQDYESVRYSFEMHKPENLDSIYNDEASIREANLNIKQRRFNKDVRPNTFNLPYGSRNITVYQPNIYERSFALNKARSVGITTSAVTTLLLPEPLSSLGVDERDIRVYANNVPCKKLRNVRNASSDYSFSTDGEKIVIKDDSESFGREVKILISPSESSSWLEGDKVYFRVSDFTDKDKNQLLLRSFNKRTIPAEDFFEDSNDSIKLSNEFVCNVSVIDGSSQDVSNRYDIDTQRGRLDLIEGMPPELPITVKYEYFNYKSARPNSFLIEDKKVIGFSIDSNLVNINEYIHRVSENAQTYEHMRNVGDLINKTPLTILFENSARKIFLKSKNILRKSFHLPVDFFSEDLRPLEVNYENGRNEFIDVAFVTEPIPLMDTNISGELRFTLRRTPSTQIASYRIFKDNEELSPSSYSLSIEGRIVTLQTTESSSRGLSISYSVDENTQLDERYVKYSVDYTQGIVYFNTDVDLTSNKEMRYSTCMSSLESSVCKQLADWTFEEGVLSLDPSNASDYNSLVKISWEDAIEEDYENLKDYFSPLVYKVEYKIEG